MTRQRRDPAVKAQEALDIARRKVAKIRARHKALKAELVELEAELDVAERDVEYLAKNPRLAKPKTPPPAKETA
ncbi:MAG: hypothetical protein LC798_10675 [Chloroflexi bacterium]|nr:hypothetical protein [Chloroflexota bacterium]